METNLRDALIPAFVTDVRIDTDDYRMPGMNGQERAFAGRRHIKLNIELVPRSEAELNWFLNSLYENGSRVAVTPNGSPFIHPGEGKQASKDVPASSKEIVW